MLAAKDVVEMMGDGILLLKPLKLFEDDISFLAKLKATV